MTQLLEKPMTLPVDSAPTAETIQTNGAHSPRWFLPFADTPVQTEPRTILLTREMVAAMHDKGFLNGLHYQLINGRIVVYMAQGSKHRFVVLALIEWLLRFFAKDYIQTQANIDVRPEDHPTSEPEPDIAVLVKSTLSYFNSGAPASDVRLAIEVSHTSLDFDTGEKADLYARAGIADYWVVDIVGRSVIVHRKPEAGKYTDIQTYHETDSLAPLAAPEHSVLIAEILPPDEDARVDEVAFA